MSEVTVPKFTIELVPEESNLREAFSITKERGDEISDTFEKAILEEEEKEGDIFDAGLVLKNVIEKCNNLNEVVFTSFILGKSLEQYDNPITQLLSTFGH